jgi:diguanylate cyclase (GGDEF)-like protein
LGIRRQLFRAQVATLGIVTLGAIGGWWVSLWIGNGPQQQAERLAEERDHLAHVSFDLLGATPHTAAYLLSSPADLNLLIRRDIRGLQRFREELDEHLSALSLATADPQLHRELETIRLLTVQVEQSLKDFEVELKRARQQGRPPRRTQLEAIARHPSIEVIRDHSDLMAELHDRLDAEYATQLAAQQRAVLLGLTIWASLLLAAWLLGLFLTWRTGERLLDPLVRLEKLMRTSPQRLEGRFFDADFLTAPSEIVSLSTSFQTLVLEVNNLLAQLEDQLRTDGLTAVGSRRHFDDTFEQEWKRSLLSGDSLSLLLIDVDHFKLFNDHYGHIEGDRCLQQVALAIRSQVRRSSDVVCRIGGEEFAVLLPATPAAEAVRVAQAIIATIDDLAVQHATSPVAGWVTTSIGVASCTPTAALAADDLKKRADKALYTRKKKMGRHGICVADAGPMAQDPH